MPGLSSRGWVFIAEVITSTRLPNNQVHSFFKFVALKLFPHTLLC